ncbi:MAG: hypothetical protein ABSG44_17105 [Thermodesulfobacteriota bacterium]
MHRRNVVRILCADVPTGDIEPMVVVMAIRQHWDGQECLRYER